MKLVHLLLLMLLIYSLSKAVLSSGVYSFVLNDRSEKRGSAVPEPASGGSILNLVCVLWESGDPA